MHFADIVAPKYSQWRLQFLIATQTSWCNSVQYAVRVTPIYFSLSYTYFQRLAGHLNYNNKPQTKKKVEGPELLHWHDVKSSMRKKILLWLKS